MQVLFGHLNGRRNNAALFGAQRYAKPRDLSRLQVLIISVR